MPEVELREFDERLNGLECGQEIRDVVAFLRSAAENAGPMAWRAHSTPGGGWGLTAKKGGRVFCRLDPKPAVPHVCVQIKGASEDELRAAGRVHRRKNAGPWVDVKELHSAKILEPLIQRAYLSPGPSQSRPAGTHAPGVDPGPTVHVSLAAPITSASSDGLTVEQELEARGFVLAGVIRSADSGGSCRFEPQRVDFSGRVVYSLVVDGAFMKAGDTGRKNATLRKRMDACARTINQTLSGVLVGPFTENFKRLAPRAIAANHEIQVWAREASAEECRRYQRELNRKYDTIRTGWANRLE